jgi:hypothetical protein
MLGIGEARPSSKEVPSAQSPASAVQPPANPLPDLAPARWIWYPSGRCLANTFVLFRRSLELPSAPVRANGWISADSRYSLEVNGQRAQWGPAPCDPRWLDADPINLTGLLKAGSNAIGATVLFYGLGDGTSPLGKPGFLFRMEIECEDGSRLTLVSDDAWRALLARAWQPGHYKRWYLRSLQEEFDARHYPYGWTRPGFAPDANWLPAMALECPAGEPPLCSNYDDYLLGTYPEHPESCALRARTIPPLSESLFYAQLAESMWIEWLRPAEEYFECRAPNAFRAVREPSAHQTAPDEWQVQMQPDRAAALTFVLDKQVSGWPRFSIDAPAGTVIDMMLQESHTVRGPALLNTHFDSWTRFICREGANDFECFDYESCRWIQLHIRNASGPVTVRAVGIRRRVFPWPHTPRVEFQEPALQRLIAASLNTLNGSAQETIIDGGGRERQQYSGDGGHQLHAIHLTMGETRLPARFVTTFSQGITQDGYFLDCWPAYDRLARLAERQLQLTQWGPILDHSVGFNFDCYYHYMYSGRLDDLREPYPRLLRFARYLQGQVGADGLMPVENIGIPYVWIDHVAFKQQRHKQCAYNLYAAAMLQHALAPLCRAFGDTAHEQAARSLGQKLEAAMVRRFWDSRRGVFVNNLPWLDEEKGIRMDDRSLATSVLFDQCPEGATANALRTLAECPPEMGFSYPCNAGWRLWALGEGGRADVIVKDYRERWATLPSVLENLTLQEGWVVQPDSGSEWSHCPLIPLYVTHMSLAGIKPLAPGFARCEIRPQLADLEALDLDTWTPLGPIVLEAKGKLGDRQMRIVLPHGCDGELIARREEKLALEPLSGPAPEGWVRYRLPAGEATFSLKFA